MPPAIVDEDSYDENEDSDFAPEAIPAPDEDAASDSSESENDVPTPTAISIKTSKTKPKKRKRVGFQTEEAEDLGIENSGDEAIIKKGAKEKRKKGKGKDAAAAEDSGGEGGVVKTRSMRAQEKVEKKPLTNTTTSTVDVDALWSAMISGQPINISPSDPQPILSSTQPGPLSPDSKRNQTSHQSRSPSSLRDDPNNMIMIKRTTTFAGVTKTEQKLVPKNSAEAKLYLGSIASQPDSSAPSKDTPVEEVVSPLFTKAKRPPKLARRSIFEPVVENLPQRTDLHFGVRRENGNIVLLTKEEKGKKLNTVEKSAMDWAGFVDKEGIADELDAAGKKLGNYKERQAFLARVEQKKEDDARRARGVPVGGLGTGGL